MPETILVVDDDQDFLDATSNLLEAVGYTVHIAMNEKDAVEVGREAKPDLILLDLIMERADSGFSLAHKFRAMPETSDAGIIVITGVTELLGHRFSLNTPEERNWIKADMFLEKPIRPEDLIGHIHQLLEHKVA